MSIKRKGVFDYGLFIVFDGDFYAILFGITFDALYASPSRTITSFPYKPSQSAIALPFLCDILLSRLVESAPTRIYFPHAPHFRLKVKTFPDITIEQRRG